MARIIFTSRYLKNAPAKKLKSLINYMAKRPGVEMLEGVDQHRPATDNQNRFIDATIRQVPEIKESFEYEDYTTNPTIGNAKELIDSIVENNIDKTAGIRNYVEYVARRPRAERSSEGHGLWNGSDDKISLSKVADEVASHKGYLWTYVVSLRRVDAERLGYNNAAAWRELVKSKIPTIADSMGIPVENLKWYGSFHNEKHHPHIHLLVYSQNPSEGFLKTPGIEKMRSAFGTEIFKDDLMYVYEHRTEVRKELNQFADERIKKLTEQIESDDYDNPVVSQLMVMLSQELKTIKGRKVYGNLKGADKKVAKNLVDNIITELSKEKNIAEIYGHWCDLQDEIKKTYMKNTPQSTALVDEKEFNTIKNMVLRYADGIRNVGMSVMETVLDKEMEADIDRADSAAMEDGSIFDESHSEYKGEASADDSIPESTAFDFYVKWTDEYKKGRQHLYGKGVPQDYAKAYELFVQEAEKGNALALYDVGKMHLAGLFVDMDVAVAQEWFTKAHDAFISVEATTDKKKDYIQYRIGKLYNLGHGVEKHYTKAAEWFQKSADQGNQFAQYSLGGLYYYGHGVEQSFEKAFDLYSESYEQNNTFAAYELGKMHRDGIGTEVDIDEAQECFAVAYAGFVKLEKENGGDQLQHHIGQMCVAGEGTDINIPKAVEYFKKAMDLENVHSLHALTKIYKEDTSAIDIRAVIEKLTMAAENNDSFAQYSLGSYYAFDKTERNTEKAMYWLAKSAEQGNAYAAKLIEYLNNPKVQQSAASATANLLRHMSKIIADDYENQRRKYDALIDKKLMRKIMQKKQEHGMKQTFE